MAKQSQGRDQTKNDSKTSNELANKEQEGSSSVSIWWPCLEDVGPIQTQVEMSWSHRPMGSPPAGKRTGVGCNASQVAGNSKDLD